VIETLRALYPSLPYDSCYPSWLRLYKVFPGTSRNTKRAHLIPWNSTDAAADTAQLVFDHVVTQHSMPCVIVSDRDSNLLQNSGRHCSIALVLNSAYQHHSTLRLRNKVNIWYRPPKRCYATMWTINRTTDWSSFMRLTLPTTLCNVLQLECHPLNLT